MVETIFLLPKSDVDYNYMSTPDPYSAASQGGSTTLTAGKMLGGSSALNHFYFMRGCPYDFDAWAEITGDISWKYEYFKQYFIKSERLEDEEIFQKYESNHGKEGPVGLTRQISNQLESYLCALNEVGHPTVLDLNSDTIGYWQPLYTIADKVRQSTASTYLPLVMNNENFYVSKNTRVARVIFETNIAVAVEAYYNNQKYVLRANKEIILSAGVFNTPQILMLSGIGPEDHLRGMGINVLANLPVGKTLTDHVSTLVYKTEKHDSVQANVVGADPDLSKVPFGVTIGNIALNCSQFCPDYQAYGLLFAYDTMLLTFICRDIFWYRSEICDCWQKDVEGRDSLFTLIGDVIPQSRGSVCLNSLDPFDDPLITTGYFKNSEDLDNMVKYVKNFIEVGRSTFFQQIGAELVGLNFTECACEVAGSDDFWRCYIRNRAVSLYHSSGTCPMGTVVGGDLKLIGFERIRIIDASVMPVSPKSGLYPAVLALAEKGADMIKEDNNILL